jgi:hypothetical protein
MSELSRGILLAILAFVLGLVANQINRLVSRERKRLSFTVSSRPIVTVTDTLPPAVKNAVPAESAVNIYEHAIVIRNSGKKPFSSVKLELVPERDTTILGNPTVESQPPRGVSYSTSSADGELRIDDISLTRDQELRVDFYTKSTSVPAVKHYFSGGGEDPPTFEESSRQTYQGVERHVAVIIRNLIASIAAPAVVTAFGSVAAGTVSIIFTSGPGGNVQIGGLQIGVIGILQILGPLIQAYFLLRILPSALALARILTSRRSGGDSIPATPASISEKTEATPTSNV